MVLFGVSNMMSDVIEVVKARGHRVRAIVLNMPEQTRPRTKDLATRLRELDEHPTIMTLDEFRPWEGVEYFVVPVTPEKAPFVEHLKTKYALRFAQLVHPAAYLSPHATVGEGVFIGAHSVIGPGCVLHDHVSVGRGVTVGHDSVLHPFVRLNPGSNVAGHVELGEGAVVGLGANIIEELIIGKGAVVASGAVVIKDVPEWALVAGVPAVVKKFYNA